MTGFLAGVIIVVISTFARSVYTLITLEEWFVSVRTTTHWLPTTVSIGFLSGTIIAITSSSENHSQIMLVSVLCIVITVLLSYLLDKRLSVVGVALNSNGNSPITGKFVSTVVLFLSFIISLIPYLLYFGGWLPLSLGLVFSVGCVSLYWFSWDSLQKAAENEAKKCMLSLLSSYVDRSAIAFEKAQDQRQLLGVSVEGISLYMQQVEQSLEHVHLFKAFRGDGNHEGLKIYFLSNSHALALFEEVQSLVKSQLMAQQAIFRILIGPEIQQEEAKSSLRQNYDSIVVNGVLSCEDFIGLALERRAELGFNAQS